MPPNGVFVFQTLWTLSALFSRPLLNLLIKGVLNPEPVSFPLLGDTVSPKSQPVPIHHLFLIFCPLHGPIMWSSTPVFFIDPLCGPHSLSSSWTYYGVVLNPFPCHGCLLLLSSTHSASHLACHLFQEGFSDSFSGSGSSLNTISPQWSPGNSLRVAVTDASLCPQQQLSTCRHCTATVCRVVCSPTLRTGKDQPALHFHLCSWLLDENRAPPCLSR